MRKTVVWLALTFSCQHSWQRLIYFQCTFSFITPSTFGERKKMKKILGFLLLEERNSNLPNTIYLGMMLICCKLLESGLKPPACSLSQFMSQKTWDSTSAYCSVWKIAPPPPKKTTSDFCSKWTASRISHQVSLLTPHLTPKCQQWNHWKSKSVWQNTLHNQKKKKGEGREQAGGGEIVFLLADPYETVWGCNLYS